MEGQGTNEVSLVAKAAGHNLRLTVGQEGCQRIVQVIEGITDESTGASSGRS